MEKPVMPFANRAKTFVFVFAAAAGLAALSYLLGVGCPIRYVTGIPCPGCGLTRAYWAVLHLDFAAAFSYHPLFWLIPFLLFAAYTGCKGARTKKLRDGALMVSGFAFLAVYVVRLALDAVP